MEMNFQMKNEILAELTFGIRQEVADFLPVQPNSLNDGGSGAMFSGLDVIS
jgi:hypothetical protein